MNRLVYFFLFIVFISNLLFENYSQTNNEKKRTQKISTNDHYKYIAINEVLMWVSNNGDGSHDPRTDGNGFYWPGGEQAVKSAIFEDGLVYGGIVNGQIRVNGNTHRQGLQAGKILSPGIADDPTLPKYRVYRIRNDWQSFAPGPERDELEKDYNEWPVEDGAPWVDVNDDGIFTRGIDKPKFEGDEVLWYVANDLDTTRTRFTYGSPPIGLEFQTTVYGFFSDSSNVFGNVVFKKYRVINKSDTVITDMYFTYWTDVDLGDAADDYTGFDTTLQMGYTYNADNDDGGGSGNAYGFAPPAVGHMIIQAPVVPASFDDNAYYNGDWINGYRNLRMNATGLIIKSASSPWPRDCQQGVYDGSIEWYNVFQGLNNFGTEIINPLTNTPTKFPLCGDPVTGVGWYEGPGWPGGPAPADRRFHVPVGPFNIAPGDTQEIVIAIFISKGNNNISSVARLKKDAAILREAYTNGLNTKPAMDSLDLHAYPKENKILLWWSDESEYFDLVDKRISYKILSDSTYTFEGYKIWQYSDSLGNNPTLLNIFDKQNEVYLVRDYVLINGIREYITVLNSPNTGLKRFVEVEDDALTHSPLYDGTPYYFGITAYAYSAHSYPKIIESPVKIIQAIPGKKPIDLDYTYSEGDTIFLAQTNGLSDVSAKLYVSVPTALTGDTYEVEFTTVGNNYLYSFINKTMNDTLIENALINDHPVVSNTILDGMKLIVDIDDEVFNVNHPIKNIVELKGPGGSDINPPLSVFEIQNSTNQWQIKAVNYNALNGYVIGDLRTINYRNSIVDYDYEIRFTSSGSEYFTTGYSLANPTLASNPKGKGRVPFEVWEISRNNSEPPKRLFIKTADSNPSLRDTAWTKDPVNNYWESIYVYEGTIEYAEPLPQFSGTSSSSQHRFGHFCIVGELPAEGTVIRINTHKPPVTGDVFTAVAVAPTRNNFESAKQNIDQITIFPNPYFGSSTVEAGGTQRIVRMTNLPQNVTVRIYSLAGVFIKRIDKDNPSPWLDWNLRNEEGSLIGSGIYLIFLDMPGIGTKILKLAVVQSN